MEKPGKNYPWAAVGINCTVRVGKWMGVCSEFGMTNNLSVEATRYYHLLQGGEEAFHALFMLYFILFDDAFTELKATYMDTNKVFASTDEKFLKILTSNTVVNAPALGQSSLTAMEILRLSIASG